MKGRSGREHSAGNVVYKGKTVTVQESGGAELRDTEILDLYWAREERAISETQNSYGNYCYSIA